MMSAVHSRPDSFPSAHAAVMFFGSFFLIYGNFYVLGILALIAAVLTSIGRIKLYYHYLIDILAGGFLALIWLIFTCFIARM
jgi:membrane-associated phospholipid phosphatase